MDYNYIFTRQHPDYLKNLSGWERCLAAYSGGSDYINQALIQHVSEIDLEFQERLNRAYYFNYPRKIARLITQYLLATPPVRLNAEPEMLEDFSRSGLHVNDVMRQFSTTLNIYGSAWMLVEMPHFEGSVDYERQRNENLRPYAVVLPPASVTDWANDENGDLAWVIVAEDFYNNLDPFAEPVTLKRRRLWTKNNWKLFESDSAEVKLIAEGEHPLNAVPLIHVREQDGCGINAHHWFEDAVRISDAILNNESEAQMNIIKQMFGLLVISENFARGSRPVTGKSSSQESKFSHILARSAAIWESSDESGISRYIAPNGAETSCILAENQHLKDELFDVVGLPAIKSSRSNQSAESKAWDHQQINKFLLNGVDTLEQTETAVWQFMHRYDPSLTVPHISYNRDFSALDWSEMLSGLLQLNTINAGKEFRKEIARTALTILDRYQKIPPERRDGILDEIEMLESGVI